MRAALAVLLLICGIGCANVEAQVLLQPQPYPDRIAVNESWYLSGEPLPLFGGLYDAAGPTVFFKPNEMAPATSYGGVMLYADTTLEPFSSVYVPIGRGLMRPYERRRAGAVAGTSGSTLSSFSVQPASDVTVAVNPRISQSAAIDAAIAESRARLPERPTDRVANVPPAVGTTGSVVMLTPAPPPSAPPARTHMATIGRPRATSGVWIEFNGERWRAAGKAEEFAEGRFVRYGEHRSFPVYVARGGEPPQRIYLPVRAGLVAPYERVDRRS